MSEVSCFLVSYVKIWKPVISPKGEGGKKNGFPHSLQIDGHRMSPHLVSLAV